MTKDRQKKNAAPTEDVKIKSFLDMIAPSIVKFNTDHFICGNTFRCVWSLREYPTATEEQAILRHLKPRLRGFAKQDGITKEPMALCGYYTRQVTPAEEKNNHCAKLHHNAANKNKMNKSNTNDLQQTVTAENNLQDVANLVASMHRNREPLLHCAVYIELTAHDYDNLKMLQTEVLTELVRSKLNVDRLMLRQQQGLVGSLPRQATVMPSGWNVFGSQFERVLPASSVANLYLFNYSGKTDERGF